jgi:hypothetical protein
VTDLVTRIPGIAMPFLNLYTVKSRYSYVAKHREDIVVEV